MALLFSVPSFQVLIGGLDITSRIDSFVVSHPTAEIGTPLVWSGSIALARLLYDPQAGLLDDLVYPNLWAKGQQQVKVYLYGQHWQTFRIGAYEYDEDTGQSQISLTDALGLLDSRKSPKDAPGITTGENSHWSKVVRELVSQAIDETGASIGVAIAASGSTNDVFSTPRTVNNGYIQEAQKIAGERGYWLWCDKEVIRLAKYPTTQPQIIYSYGRKRVELFQRQRGLQEPLEKLTVVCTCDRLDPCNEHQQDPRIEEFFDEVTGKLLRRVTTWKRMLGQLAPVPFDFNLANSELTNVKVEMPLNAVLGQQSIVDVPELYKDNDTLITAALETTVRVFDSQGYALVEGTGKKEPFCVVAPQIGISGPLVNTTLVDSEKTEKRYIADNRGVLRKITHRIQQPLYKIFADSSPVIVSNQFYPYEDITEVWASDRTDGEPPCNGYEYKKTVMRLQNLNSKINPLTLGMVLIKENAPTPNSTPPERPTKEPPYPVKQHNLKGDRKFAYKAVSPFIEKEDEHQASSLTSDSGCEALASLLGSLRWQRYYSRRISHPVNSQVLTYQPFQGVHVHNGSFIRDGFTLSIGDGPSAGTTTTTLGDGDKEAGIDFVGNYLGKITPVFDPPAAPPLPYSPTGALVIGPVGNFTTYSSNELAVDLVATGGTYPYTFTATGLPVGLSVSGSQIVGTPAESGSFVVTVQVEDADGVISSVELELAVEAEAQPDPLVIEIVQVEASHSHTGEVSDYAIAPITVVESGHDYLGEISVSAIQAAEVEQVTDYVGTAKRVEYLELYSGEELDLYSGGKLELY